MLSHAEAGVQVVHERIEKVRGGHGWRRDGKWGRDVGSRIRTLAACWKKWESLKAFLQDGKEEKHRQDELSKDTLQLYIQIYMDAYLN